MKFGRFNEIKGDSPEMERVPRYLGMPVVAPVASVILQQATMKAVADLEDRPFNLRRFTADELLDGDWDPEYPVLVIENRKPGSKREAYGAVCLFRCYKYQVTNMHGDWDHGSSSVKDLPAMIAGKDFPEAKKILLPEIAIAIAWFCNRENPEKIQALLEKEPLIDELIESSIKYMATRKMGGHEK